MKWSVRTRTRAGRLGAALVVATISLTWLSHHQRAAAGLETVRGSRDPRLSHGPLSLHVSAEQGQRSTPTVGHLAGDSVNGPGHSQIHQNSEQAPAWTIGYGKEFWRAAATKEKPSVNDMAAASHVPATLNLSAVIERVSHALSADPATAVSIVKAKTYSASFDAQGFRFSPHLPVRDWNFADDPAESATLLSSSQIEPAHSKGARSRALNFPLPDPKTEAVFRTVSVQRDNQILYSAEESLPPRSILGNTAQALLEPGGRLVEHYEARAEGVAVTWILSRPLPGIGPLVIDTELSGLTHAASTEQGHHFADAAGQLRVRVGKAQAVDAAGKTWPLDLQVVSANDGRMHVQVPATILTQAIYPLAIDPVISPEFGVDQPVSIPAVNNQVSPAVAFNGSIYLIVWEDYRDTSISDGDIYGARVTPSGEVLDPFGLALCVNSDQQYAPAVAAQSSDFLVVWADLRNLPSGRNIYGTRVTGQGVVSDPDGLAICSEGQYQSEPAVAANASGYFVVWTHTRHNPTTEYGIYGTRISLSGLVLDTNGIAVSKSPAAQPAVAANRDGFLVVWADYRRPFEEGPDIYGAQVNNSGTVQGSGEFPICTTTKHQHSPAVAALENNFLVVWEDGRDADTDIYGARISGTGVALDPGGFPLCTATAQQAFPAVAANGKDFIVVWTDRRTNNLAGALLYGTRVSSNGDVVTANGALLCATSNYQSTPAIGASGDDFLVVWNDLSRDIVGARITSEGAVTGPCGFIIGKGPNSQTAPVVAFNGTEYLIVWQDDRNNMSQLSDIYGVRVTPAGTTVDPSGIAICTHTNNQFSPTVAASGSDYLVVWTDERNSPQNNSDLYGTIVNGNGMVADVNGFAICTVINAQRAAAVASNGSDFLAVWRDDRNPSTDSFAISDIFGARISKTGVVLDAGGIAICTVTNEQQAPVVASNGRDYLVAWRDDRNDAQTASDIYAARVTSEGAVLEPNGLAISTALRNQRAPEIASNGSDYLIVWRDDRNRSQTDSDIFGTRVTSGGLLLDTNGIPICTVANEQREPVVAANGGDYLVAWQDYRNLATTGNDIYGTRVSSSGKVSDAASFAINAGFLNDQILALTGGPAGQFLLVSEGPRNGAARVVANLVSLDERPVFQKATYSSGQMTLTWSALAEQTFRVQFKANLNDAVWTDLSDPLPANGMSITYQDSAIGGAPQRFYRVVQLP